MDVSEIKEEGKDEHASDTKEKGADERLNDEREELFLKARKTSKEGNMKFAAKTYLKACRKGHFHSCHKFVYLEEVAGRLSRSQDFYRVSCNNGILKSCNNLAITLEKQGSVKMAKELYTEAYRHSPGKVEERYLVEIQILDLAVLRERAYVREYS